MGNYDVRKIREDFPLLKRRFHGKPLAYLDNAATSQKPRHVIDAMSKYYEHSNANVHRGIYELSEEATVLYEGAHDTTRTFLHAKNREEIIFTKNSTEALNLAARSLVETSGKGDEIIVTAMEHHSNFVPWQQLALKKGLKLKIVPITESHTLDMDKLGEMITKKTKAVSVVHVSNSLGAINDVKKISKMAHAYDALCVVDGSQSVPHQEIDVEDLDVDLFAFTGHKMLGPTGIGVLYGKQEALEEMPPFLYGGDMIADVGFEKTTFNHLPWKFEAGTPNIAEAVGLTAAMQYLKNVSLKRIEAYEKELSKYMHKRFNELEGVTLYGPDLKNRSTVFSFNVDGVHSHDVGSMLDSEGVAIRTGHHCTMPLMKTLGVSGTARASLYLYNTKEEVDRLIDGVGKVKKMFK